MGASGGGAWARGPTRDRGEGPPAAGGGGGRPVGLAEGALAGGGAVAWGSGGPVSQGGRQLTASGGERAVSRGEGAAMKPAPSPGSRATTISIEDFSTYHLELRGSCGWVQVLWFS